VQKNLEVPFESMDNLLMTISPMFRERFQQALYDKLESVHRHQHDPTHQTDSSNVLSELSQLVSESTSKPSSISTSNAPTLPLSTSIMTDSLQPQLLLQNQHQPTSNQPQHYLSQQQQLDLDQALSQEVLDDLHNWIH
jgi:hypothetical protein